MLEERDERADEQWVSRGRAQGGTDAIGVARTQLDDRGNDGIVEPTVRRRLGGVSECAQHGCAVEPGHALDNGEVGQRVLRGVVEVFTLALQSSLECVHIAGFEPAGHEELHRRREQAGHVHGSQRVPGNECRHHQDDRSARTLSERVRDHVDDRLG